METRKFEYLESIRDTIEHGEYEELEEYVGDIFIEVKNDPDFSELLKELRSKHYKDVVAMIDEIIYKDMQSEFEELFDNAEIEGLAAGESYELDMDIEDVLPEGIVSPEISFEEFNEEDYSDDLENDF